jgi:hypothetical protein
VQWFFFQKKKNHALPPNLPSFENLAGWVDATSGVGTGFFSKKEKQKTTTSHTITNHPITP